MKYAGLAAIGLLILSGGISPATAGDRRADDLALLGQAQARVSSRLATSSVDKGSAQYALRGELEQIDRLIAELEAGRDVDPRTIERALKRARVIQ